jgi:glycosyl transferase, family 25
MNSVSCDIFVINLEQDIMKKEHIQNHFREHGVENYTFIKAIDGRKLSGDELLEVYDEKKALEVHGRPLARGEIGCTLSHLECYKKIISQNLPGAFIFEDDVVFSVDTTCLMKKIQNNSAQLKTGVVLLGYAKYVCTYNTLINLTNKYCLKKIHKAGFSHGYFITHKAAQEILNFFSPISFPIDIWRRVQNGCSVNVYSCFPYCIDV